MKKIFLLGCILSAGIFSKAGLLTVSNNSGFPAQYATIAAAITAANAGDTIYVYATGNYYGEVNTLTKRLIIFGGGSQTNGGCWTDRINCNPGSDGSVISGFGFAANANCSANNVAYTDCQFNSNGGCFTFNGNNGLLENNIFYIGLCLNTYGLSNIVIRNNIFYSGFGGLPGITGTVSNNVFSSATAGDGTFWFLQNGEAMGNGLTISNNIFYKKSPAHGVVSQCNFIKNIYYDTNGNVPPVNAGSSGNIEADPQFENYPAGGISSYNLAHSYKILAASPGHNYGTDGTDVGVWGGQNPMNVPFYAPLPRVYEITAVNNTVPQGGQLQLTIKATKAH
jgi:hypothetical protein